MKKFTYLKFKEVSLIFGLVVLLSAIWINFAYAQTSPSGSLLSSQIPSYVIHGVKIISPSKDARIPINNVLHLSGISNDNITIDCRVLVILNDVRPYQNTSSAGPGGANDYSKWNFTLTPNYSSIKEGVNKITAKFSCDNNPSFVSYYSINVTGVSLPIATTKSQHLLPSADATNANTTTTTTKSQHLLPSADATNANTTTTKHSSLKHSTTKHQQEQTIVTNISVKNKQPTPRPLQNTATTLPSPPQQTQPPTNTATTLPSPPQQTQPPTNTATTLPSPPQQTQSRQLATIDNESAPSHGIVGLIGDDTVRLQSHTVIEKPNFNLLSFNTPLDQLLLQIHGVKIISPSKGEEVPVNDNLQISGTSLDNAST